MQDQIWQMARVQGEHMFLMHCWHYGPWWWCLWFILLWLWVVHMIRFVVESLMLIAWSLYCSWHISRWAVEQGAYRKQAVHGWSYLLLLKSLFIIFMIWFFFEVMCDLITAVICLIRSRHYPQEIILIRYSTQTHTTSKWSPLLYIGKLFLKSWINNTDQNHNNTIPSAKYQG